jgi:hypothetical protein
MKFTKCSQKTDKPTVAKDKVLDISIDPRRRRSYIPTRIVWISERGVDGPENLLDTNHADCTLSPNCGAGFVLDFGTELHGGICIEVSSQSPQRPVRVRVRFGESVSETMQRPDNDHAIHDWDIKLAWCGRTEVGQTGFRFVRIDLIDDGPVTIQNITAISLGYEDPYVGTFECSDPRLNEIWEVGARTVRLCMQDFLWDGIKRDRLAWIGDMHPEIMVISSLYGEHPIVPASLDKVKSETPLPGFETDIVNPFWGSLWMNSISTYSLCWIIIQRDWYRYHGNLDYLKDQHAYLTGLTDLLLTRIDDNGKETLDSRFLEWPTSTDPKAIDAGLQALMAMSFDAAAELFSILGDGAYQAIATETAGRLKVCQRSPTESKQANALIALAGMADASHTNAWVLSKDPSANISTYYGYYVLQARAKAGDYAGCLDVIRTFWGGMIDLGATTFWEDFNLEWTPNATRIDELPAPGRPDIHADFGDFCYKGLRHSLCHGWAAGPTAWLMEHVLGISPAEPGFTKVAVKPNLAGLAWARGTFPTPRGMISVSHSIDSMGEAISKIDLPDGIELI